MKHAGETFQVITGHLANVREHYEFYQVWIKVHNSFITEGIF